MTEKRRVAVLGGGVGAMSAAFALSELDPQGEKYDITVYQLGWRLGGKTASGRNRCLGERIEEHGLHIWAGFYENAFTILRAALIALDRPPGTPQATIHDTFERQNQIFFSEHHDGEWLPWPIWLEPDLDQDVYPGRDSLFTEPGPIAPPLGELIRRIIDDLEGAHASVAQHWQGDPTAESRAAVADLAAHLRPHAATHTMRQKHRSGHPLLGMARHLLGGLERGVHAIEHGAVETAHVVLGAYHDLLTGHLSLSGIATDLRRFLEVADFVVRMVRGLLKHDCLRRGLTAIDDLEFRDFLAGDRPVDLEQQSAIVRGLYDYCFAYENGSKPSISACSAVEGMLRLSQTYKGAFFYKATAGMGDTIFTPLYQVMERRGVTFKFFHEVTRLELTEDKSLIGRIKVREQVRLAPHVEKYEPLRNVKGLDSWPSQPRWEFLEDGERLRQQHVDFEDLADPLPPGIMHTLELGEDFDDVILGLSVGALGKVCAELCETDYAWGAMVNNLKTNRTQAFQLWLDCDLADLGGRYVEPPIPPNGQQMPPQLGPILTAYQKPFDTYSDMSQLLPAEAWPEPGPKSVAYFCSTMPDADSPPHQGPANDAAKRNAIAWMKSDLHRLWPNIGQGENFRWDLLHSPSQLQGEARFDDQFWQANINLTERYVLSLPGTLQYRLDPGRSGFPNLFLAGDWTRVPEINAGCVEVAAMSGLMSAAALSGEHIPIATWNHAAQRGDAPVRAHEDTRPRFADYGGWVSLPPPPSVCRDAEIYSWALDADHDALQSFLDASVNQALHGKRLRPLLSSAFLMLVKAGTLYPEPAPFRDEGTMRETDVGFWILAGLFEGNALLPEHVGWVPACLFVDNAFTAASGREIWGFPKYVAGIETPDAAQSSGPFTVYADVIRAFGRGEHAQKAQLLDVHGSDVSFTGFDGSSIEILKHLVGSGDCVAHEAIDKHARRHALLDAGSGLGLPVFYLKQFRAADSAEAACYQEALRGALTLDAQKGAGLMTGHWSIRLTETDAFPIARELGLGTPVNGVLELQSRIAAWGAIDFTVAPAQKL